MAIWKVVLVVGAFLAGTLFITDLNPARSQECVTLDNFVEAVKPGKPKILIANAAATEKIEAYLNANRATTGMDPVDLSIVVIGVMPSNSGEFAVGTAFFDHNGCILSDTVAVVTLDQWAAFAVSAGTSADDFSPLQDS